MIRSFDLLDLPTLHRYRHRGLCLDSTMALIWGANVVPAVALLSYLAPATGIFTYVGSSDGGSGDQPVLAQVIHPANSRSARLSFLAPENALDSSALFELIDHLAVQVGERGAHNLLAEVDERAEAYEMLRRAGFAIYARQRIWRVEDKAGVAGCGTPWRSTVARDEFAVRALYNALVPGLVQQIDPPPWERLRGRVFHQGGELLAFVDLNYGPRGIIAHPYAHPDMDQVTARLADLIQGLPNRLSRTLYVYVRSYQAWLEAAMDELGAEPGPRQAVMVKRLVVPALKQAEASLPDLSRTRANPTLPLAQSFTQDVKNW